MLHLSDSGQRTYAAIIGSFNAREKAMLQTLDPGERRELGRLFDKIIAAADSWARPY